MKAVVIERPRQAVVQEVPAPEPGPDEVVVQVAACGICGTDKHIYAGGFLSRYPLIPGHEFSGTIAEVGQRVSDIKPGDRVAVDPSLFCGQCYYCRKLHGNHCLNWGAIGDTTSGAFAEYVKVPARNCFALPDHVSFGEAALIEPLACVVWGQKRLQPQPGDSVLLLGAGPVAQLWVQMLRHGNAGQIVVTDLHEPRLELARKLGASATVQAGEGQREHLEQLAPFGFDIVIDVTGIPSVVQDGISYVGPMGKLMMFGVCPMDSQVTIDPFQVYHKDLTIIGSMAINHTFSPAVALVESRAIELEPLISHSLPLDDFNRALQLAGSSESVKVQIAPQLT